MTYLGDIGVIQPLGEAIWWRSIVAESQIGTFVGQYATYGGYIYVG